MIDAAYRATYEHVFRQRLAQAPHGDYYEMALPSYTHGNRLMAALFWRRLEAAFALAGNLQGRAVLDFGCGGCVTFRHLQAEGCDITGLDPRASALAADMCELLGVHARIVRTLGELKGQRFGCILALDVLEHVDDLDACINELTGLLEPGGRLVLSGPTENLWYRLGRFLAGFSGHYHVRTVYDIERAFAEHGLDRLGCEVLRLPFALFRVSAWAKMH